MDVFNRLKKFLVQLVQDDQFRHQLASMPEAEQDQLLAKLGYHFSEQEWEAGMLQILDAKERDEFEELNDEQLMALAGAGVGRPGRIISPMYGGPSIDPDGHGPNPPCRWWNCLPSGDHYPPTNIAIYGAPVVDLKNSAQ